MDVLPNEQKLLKKVEVSRELMKLSEHESWEILGRVIQEQRDSFERGLLKATMARREPDALWKAYWIGRMDGRDDFFKSPDKAVRTLEKALEELNRIEDEREGEE